MHDLLYEDRCSLCEKFILIIKEYEDMFSFLFEPKFERKRSQPIIDQSDKIRKQARKMEIEQNFSFDRSL